MRAKTKATANTLGILHNVEVLGFDADVVRDYHDYLSERKRRQGFQESRRAHNLVVNAGLNQIVDLMIGTDTDSFTYSAVGSNNTAVAASDTALNTQISSRHTITSRYKVSVGQAHFDTFYGSSENNGTWVESGIFNASTLGDMLARLTFSSFVKSASNTAALNWTTTLTAV